MSLGKSLRHGYRVLGTLTTVRILVTGNLERIARHLVRKLAYKYTAPWGRYRGKRGGRR